MTLFELLDTEGVRTMGRRAIERAKVAGVPAYYRGEGGEFVKEMPDGTRLSVARIDGEEVVLATLPRHGAKAE